MTKSWLQVTRRSSKTHIVDGIMNCPFCQIPIEPNQTFCDNCGSDISAYTRVAAPPAPVPAPDASYDEPEEQSNAHVIIIAVAGGALLLIVALVLVLTFRNHRSSDRPSYSATPAPSYEPSESYEPTPSTPTPSYAHPPPPEPPPPPPPPPPPTSAYGPQRGRPWTVVVGRHNQDNQGSRRRADRTASEFRSRGWSSTSVYDGRNIPGFQCCYWWVIVNSFSRRSDAHALRDEIVASGYTALVKDAYR